MQRRPWSVRVATIAGIEIRLHASMLLLVWLAAAAAESDPGGAAGSFGWIALIFLCVLVHEFSHSLVARHLGVGVREIELLPIGGVSKMERIPDKPRDELAIALAGPAASIAIGASVLAGVVLTTGVWPSPTLAGGGIPARIGWFNLVIGAFNLLPALPLDGGRVLRALFEAREGPRRATHHAARVARVLALGMIVVGAVTNVFLMVIGLFVSVVSRVEEMNVEVHEHLLGVRVRDLMVRSPLVVSASATVGTVRQQLTETCQRQFPVVDQDGIYAGLVDATRLGRSLDSTPIADVAVPIAAVEADLGIEDSGLLSGVRALPVVDHVGHVIGLIHGDDVSLAVQHLMAVDA